MARPRKTNRRQFLQGKSAVDALEDVLPQIPEAGAPQTPLQVSDEKGSDQDPPRYLLQVGRQAMACDFDVFLNAGQHVHGTEMAVAVLDLIDRLEAQMTVYRETSEVIAINERAADEEIEVEPQLFGLLVRALELHRLTGGAFDITSGPLSRAWGFYRREGRLPTSQEVDEARSRIGSDWIRLDHDRSTIRFLRDGMEINLNAIGKGYALDRCAEFLLAQGVDNFLIHGGLSSILGRGARAHFESDQPGWRVALRHPYKPALKLGELVLQNEALGTSGSANQFFHFNGVRYGHILDPRTGWPADKVLSATVIAADGATADALATAFYVLGVEESLQVCHEMPQVSVIFVCPSERSGEVRLVSYGLRPGQLSIESTMKDRHLALPSP